MPIFLDNVDFSKTEARNLVTHKLAAAPSSPIEGQRYYDTTLKKEGVYNGTSWDYAGPASAGLGLLVYAQQTTTVPLPQLIFTTVPFNTEILDNENLFSGGFFTPSTIGIYRLECKLFLFTDGFSDIGAHGMAVFQGPTNIGWMLWTWEREWNGSMIVGQLTTPLTNGLPYHIKALTEKNNVSVSLSGSRLNAGTVKNTLTIERLI